MRKLAVIVGTVLVLVPPAAAAVHIRVSAIVDAQTGAFDVSFPDLADVAGATDDGHGGWFVTTRAGVSRVAPSGVVDGSWASPVVGRAGKIVRAGGRLYLIAQTGPAQSRVVALSTSDGHLLWRSAPFGRHAYAIAANAGSIYIGGDGIGTGARGWIEKLDARTGRLQPWHTPPFPRYSTVSTIAVGNGRVYAGGGGSSPIALDARTGALTAWSPRYDGDEVKTIVVVGRTVFVGGTFAFRAYDSTTGRRRPSLTSVGSPGILAVGGGRLYLGGDLRSTAGVDNLAAIDLRTGRVVTSWAPRLAKFVSVAAIVPSGDRVLVLGSFSASIG